MTRRLVFLAPMAFAMFALPTFAASCGEPSHVFEGRLFLAQRGCLGTSSSIDVVEGDPPGTCGPMCLAQPLTDGGRAIYVATMCGPYPFAFDAGGADPLCPKALDALARADTCLIDGGSSSPAPPPTDASSD